MRRRILKTRLQNGRIRTLIFLLRFTAKRMEYIDSRLRVLPAYVHAEHFFIE